MLLLLPIKALNEKGVMTVYKVPSTQAALLQSLDKFYYFHILHSLSFLLGLAHTLRQIIPRLCLLFNILILDIKLH